MVESLLLQQSGASSASSAQPWSRTLEPNSSTPSGSTPNPQPSLSATVSHFSSDLTRDVYTQTAALCSASSTHNAATADASTQLSIPEFLQLCLTKYPSRRMVTLQLRADLSDAQCSSDSGNPREVTCADAATQLSLSSFSNGASSPKPSRRTKSQFPNPSTVVLATVSAA